MRMNCNIIKDLLPSYIDEVCSEDTIKMVEEHLQHCEECKICLKKMQQQIDYDRKIPEEVKKAITPFKKINKKRRIQVMAAIVMTFVITLVGALVIQEVEPVRQLFFPRVVAVVAVTDDKEGWERVYFDDNHYLDFDSIFWKKRIVSSINNESDIVLRIKDGNKNVLIDDILIPPGTHINLDELKLYEKYIIEIKVPQGRYFMTAQ